MSYFTIAVNQQQVFQPFVLRSQIGRFRQQTTWLGLGKPCDWFKFHYVTSAPMLQIFRRYQSDLSYVRFVKQQSSEWVLFLLDLTVHPRPPPYTDFSLFTLFPLISSFAAIVITTAATLHHTSSKSCSHFWYLRLFFWWGKGWIWSYVHPAGPGYLSFTRRQLTGVG